VNAAVEMMPWHLTVVACLQARLHMTGQLADSPSLLTWAIAVSPSQVMGL